MLEETRKRRGERWDREFIPCKKHPDRRCNRSSFVNTRHRYCGSCKTNLRPDGSRRPAHLRHEKSEQWDWKRRGRRTQRRIEERKI